MTTVIDTLLTPLYQSAAWLPTTVAVLAAVLVWSAVGLGQYSGFNTPPEFGDFEAQRHWMELTLHLPINEWYFYKPEWWKLDYPPLTAYHSYLFGWLGGLIYPAGFELGFSEGIETGEVKAFMRVSAILSQLFVYVPAVYIYTRLFTSNTASNLTRTKQIAQLLLLPALTLIDHGHFQFNSVMLGLFTFALAALVSKKFVLASFFYISAMFFKQMGLYYAPVIFAAILGECFGPKTGFRLRWCTLACVGATVLLTAAVYLYPFISDTNQLLQILSRVFPVSRGLWEDKVSNFWCTLNYSFVKVKSVFKESQLPLLSLACTVTGFIPSVYSAYIGQPKVWPFCFASCSWAFYMFGFQVHEKSVLLPLMASMLAAVSCSQNNNVQAMSNWAGIVSIFSLLPLLYREGLQLQTFTVVLIYLYLFAEPKTFIPSSWINRFVVTSSYCGMLLILVLERTDIVPKTYTLRYPDLFVVGNMLVSFGSLFYFWLWQSCVMLKLAHEPKEPKEPNQLSKKTKN